MSAAGDPQRRIHIRGKVGRVLEPDREPDEILAHADFGTGSGAHIAVGGRRGMGGEASGITEIIGNVDDPQRIEKRKGRRLAAFHAEGDEVGKAAHLGPRDGMAGMVGSAGIEDPGDTRGVGEKIGEQGCGL